MTQVSLTALPAIPLVQAGCNLAAVLQAGLRRLDVIPGPGDVLVVAQKIVSKAEGQAVALADVTPSPASHALAEQVGKDARLVELILRDSVRVVRARPGVLIVEHRLGFVMANAGIDRSNVAPSNDGPSVLLLPRDPDASAAVLHRGLGMAIIISDSFGRAWRRGTTGVALGVAGLPALIDLRGEADLFGRPLEASMVGFADEVAAAAALVMGEAAEAQPAVLVRGLRWKAQATAASALLRPVSEDLFR